MYDFAQIPLPDKVKRDLSHLEGLSSQVPRRRWLKDISSPKR